MYKIQKETADAVTGLLFYPPPGRAAGFPRHYAAASPSTVSVNVFVWKSTA